MRGPALVLAIGGIVAVTLVVAAPACKRESFEPARRSSPSVPVPRKAVAAPPVATEGPAVAAFLLRSPPTTEQCQVACDALIDAELAPYRESAAAELREGVAAVIERVRERERPPCVARCRERMTRAVTDCVRLTTDVSAAVDCLARSGAEGATAP